MVNIISKNFLFPLTDVDIREPYKCSICNLMFSDAGELSDHLPEHTNNEILGMTSMHGNPVSHMLAILISPCYYLHVHVSYYLSKGKKY